MVSQQMSPVMNFNDSYRVQLASDEKKALTHRIKQKEYLLRGSRKVLQVRRDEQSHMLNRESFAPFTPRNAA
jgi:hypothetical protein